MVGELGRIFHTTDGGTTWERQDAGTKRPFLAISCLDAQDGLDRRQGRHRLRHDGRRRDLDARSRPARTATSSRSSSPTRERGHGAGDFGTMVHTEDGGKTWTATRVPEDVQLPESALDIGVEPGDVNLYGISYGDPDHVWLVGEFGIIMASAPTAAGPGSSSRPRSRRRSSACSFLDARRGWAVGIDGVILAHRGRRRDVDAAARRRPSQRSLYDVVVRGQHGWIVGEAGTDAARAPTAAPRWALEPLPIQLAARWLRSVVAHAPSGSGLAVGAEGLVFRIDGAKLERLDELDAPTEAQS